MHENCREANEFYWRIIFQPRENNNSFISHYYFDEQCQIYLLTFLNIA